MQRLTNLAVSERWRGRKLVAVTASAKPKVRSRTVVLAKARFDTKGHSDEVATISLSAVGRRLLAQRHRLKARLTVSLASNRSC